MPKHVFRVTLSDGSTHDLAADSADEARTLARQYYTHNVKGAKKVEDTEKRFRVYFRNGDPITVNARDKADATKKARRIAKSRGLGGNGQVEATLPL